MEYQTERLIAYRNALIQHMSEKVQELNRENFAVRQHLKYVICIPISPTIRL